MRAASLPVSRHGGNSWNVSLEGMLPQQKTAPAIRGYARDRRELDDILGSFPALEPGKEERAVLPREGRASVLSALLPAAVSASSDAARRPPDEVYDEALALAKVKEYGKAMNLIDELLALDPSHVKACTLKANILVNLDRAEDALDLASRAVAMDQFCLEGYLLLGLIAKMKGDADDSIKQFKMALYVRPSCWLAHLYLGEIYHSRSEREKAGREYGIVRNLLEADGASDPGLSIFPMSMPAEQILHLCRHRLAQMHKE